MLFKKGKVILNMIIKKSSFWNEKIKKIKKFTCPGNYIILYCGPDPPSGGVHTIFCVGSLMSHALHCMQLT